MAEFGTIPARLNGVPIPRLADIQVQMARNTVQKATTDGIVLTYGRPKWQVTLNFVTLSARAAFLAQIGAYEQQPPTHNLGFDLGEASFACLRGIPASMTAGSNQDGEMSLQFTCMYEDFQPEAIA